VLRAVGTDKKAFIVEVEVEVEAKVETKTEV